MRCSEPTDILWDAPHRKLPQSAWLHGLRDDLRAIPELRELHIENWGYSDDDLRYLADIPQLTSLMLQSPQDFQHVVDAEKFTGRGFRHLAMKPVLRSLAIGWNDVESMSHVGQLASLRRLSVWGRVTDDGFEHLANLDLREFGLFAIDRSNFQGSGLRHLSGMRDLRTLYLHVNFDEANLKHLVGMKGLVFLSFYGPAITDEGLRQLEGFVELRTLKIPGGRITGMGLRHLSKMKRLEHLDLSKTSLGDDALPALIRLPALRELNLVKTSVTEAGLREFREKRPEIELIDRL